MLMMLTYNVKSLCFSNIWLLDVQQLKRIMEEDAKKVKGFKAYNILPLETPGVANVFQSFPEVCFVVTRCTSLSRRLVLYYVLHTAHFDTVSSWILLKMASKVIIFMDQWRTLPSQLI